jgi:hypothetical protein
MQGRYIKMDKGNYVDLNIDNGHTGYRRCDVIAIEYSKNDETNIEEANLVVVKGSETKSNVPPLPPLVEGDTVDGSASINQMALYRVIIDGFSIVDVIKDYTIGQDFQDSSLKGTGAGFHSSTYRGKYLGNTYTDEQKQAIANGTFDNLFIGDYWRINGVNWRIADFDYYYNIGDTSPFNKHHVVIVPDTYLDTARMNATDITTGAYTGSEMYTTNLNNARTAFDNAFGSQFIPAHRGLYANEVIGDNPSGWDWRDMRVELMNEEQVFGHAVWGATNHNGYDVGTQKTQFRLFALEPTKLTITFPNRQRYWLTNVKSSDRFAIVGDYGEANYEVPSFYIGVRPFACVVGEPEQ